MKKHFILICMCASVLLMAVAAFLYPGGSFWDKHSEGFSLTQNFFSNLFEERAINGAISPSRYWAIPGIFFMALGYFVFYYRFSERIPEKSSQYIIRYAGCGSMIFTFLAATPWHDFMVMLAAAPSMLAMFYITVHTFKTRLHIHQVLSCLSLAGVYASVYIYYSGHLLSILPVLQKIGFLIFMAWAIALYYFSSEEDFRQKEAPGAG